MFSFLDRITNRKSIHTTTLKGSAEAVVDFSGTPLARDYPRDKFYIKVIDSLFTKEECNALIRFAETGSSPWKQAALNYGLGSNESYVNTKYRNSERILKFDHDVARWIYERLWPYVSDVNVLECRGKWEGIVRGPGVIPGERWKMVGANERLTFLKYGPGNYFKEHFDGQIALPDGRNARITVQVYLNGDDELEGGATRLWSGDMKRWMDVEPRVGRVLIFQQRGVLHSGEEVKKGYKYALRTDLLYVTEESKDDGEEDTRMEVDA
ncbi:hypothetical protein AMATHDRAFT_151851 [Amanita thiersii Skay4041]|uniref:Prolyl 4-hydroxylase alpha subunit domain-containing protein n=1 Tax=Amanita thiersii Skay4041 TaxID=703135 RepID=A0A2A9NA70_9AGAR|nr:hypothetical protein AMATHDRAFT_151851 [Amanita thiersii Skay4041]